MDERVSTRPEPWILLSPLSILRGSGIGADYDHLQAHYAAVDFLRNISDGEDLYLRQIGDLALNLYESGSRESAAVFIDKTPRYHVIAHLLPKALPSARFIVLWRNPLSVIASMLSTWHESRWKIYQFMVDLVDGVDNLLQFEKTFGDRLIHVQFEDFVRSPDDVIERLSTFLDLGAPISAGVSAREVPALEGVVGDLSGQKRYSTISDHPLESWREVIDSPFRIAWVRRYLKRLGGDRLQLMGYSLEGLLDELSRRPTKMRIRDIIDGPPDWFREVVRDQVRTKRSLRGSIRRMSGTSAASLPSQDDL